jgi:hypothetical protein
MPLPGSSGSAGVHAFAGCDAAASARHWRRNPLAAGLGRTAVSSVNRVPRPPANITAFILLVPFCGILSTNEIIPYTPTVLRSHHLRLVFPHFAAPPGKSVQLARNPGRLHRSAFERRGYQCCRTIAAVLRHHALKCCYKRPARALWQARGKRSSPILASRIRGRRLKFSQALPERTTCPL